MTNKEEQLWITNISRVKDVSIGDLRITIRRGQSLNLLSKGKNGKALFNFTRKQIDESVDSGSIANNPLIRIRKVQPVIFSSRIDIAQDSLKSRALRKKTHIEIPDFPDLDFEEVTQEEFAADNADMDFADRQPVLAVDPKFRAPSEDE